MSIIAHNLSAMNTRRQWGITDRKKSAIAEKLGSGYQINRAADDAAGLSISEKMRSQIRGLEQASRNIQDGISYVQVADGALNEVHSIMQRMRELAVQAANDTYVEADREAIDAEIQQLKEEIDSILEKTEFNTRPVWDTNAEERTLAGTVKKPAVTLSAGNSSQRVVLTNDNKYRIADGYYTVHASEKGLQLSWTDYYGDVHKVPTADTNGAEQYIPLPQPDAPEEPEFPGERFLAQEYSVNFTDYMSPEDKSLGIQLPMKLSITEACTLDDVIDSLDGMTFRQNTPSSFYLEKGNTTASGISLSSGSFNSYDIMLALDSMSSDSGGSAIGGIDFSRTDDAFLEADSAANVVQPDFDNMQGNWKFTFENPNYPGVTFIAVSENDVDYSCYSREPEHLGRWWSYSKYEGKKYDYTKQYWANEASTLESVNEALTGSPNLLTGDTDNDGNGHSGTMGFRFRLTADQPIYITKPDGSKIEVGTEIGTFDMDISVSGNDTLETVKERMKSLTYIDIKSGSAEPSVSISFNGPNRTMFNSPLWKAMNKMNVQAGANSQQNIRLRYEAFRTYTMGLTDTNVLTREDAGSAISEIDDAMEMISAQRSYFGAMQNRMEHAHANADNTAENLQSSESRIRDTNMAEGMVELSKLSILEQASQSMLSHANQANQGILQLLQ